MEVGAHTVLQYLNIELLACNTDDWYWSLAHEKQRLGSDMHEKSRTN